MISINTIIYYTDTDFLKDEKLFNQSVQLLNADRQEKIRRFRFEKDKRLSAGAGLLLRTALSDYGKKTGKEFICNPNLKTVCGKNGKPHLMDYPDVFFNLSHSGSIALCVVSDMAAGCDVEKIRTADTGVMERFFPDNEKNHIMSLPEGAERDALFTRYWTLTESYIKMTGEGLSVPLRDVMINIDRNTCDISIYRSTDDVSINRSSCSFAEYSGIAGYRCAVCIEGDHNLKDLEWNNVESELTLRVN